jgi:benzodiazapine receptor
MSLKNEEWYTNLKKSSLTPSNQIFPIVWTILYIMIALSGYKYISENSSDGYGITIFSIQIFLNVIWTYLFFTLRKTKLALADIVLLWITIVLTIKQFYKKSRLAAYLLMPYLAWVSFAGYLNYYIVANN